MLIYNKIDPKPVKKLLGKKVQVRFERPLAEMPFSERIRVQLKVGKGG